MNNKKELKRLYNVLRYYYKLSVKNEFLENKIVSLLKTLSNLNVDGDTIEKIYKLALDR